MKKLNLLFIFGLILSLNINAQYTLPVTWENEDETAAWTPFENAGDAPENFAIVPNPDNTGINTSENALMYTVLDAAQPWVGAWSTAYGTMEFTNDNHIMQMMVYKDVISDCALKVEGGGADPVELRVPNTVTGEWELLTFDLSASIGITRETLVFFPDFPETRTAGSICYVDNIGWEEPAGTLVKELSKIKVSVYPSPAIDAVYVNGKSGNVVNVYNIAGKLVMSKAKTNEIEKLDVSSLASGMYIIKLGDAAQRLIIK